MHLHLVAAPTAASPVPCPLCQPAPAPAPAPANAGAEGALRTADGPNAWSGRLELCLGGAWGTICDAGWDWDDARVACRQLGLDAGGEALQGGWFPQAPASVPVHLAGVSCLGGEPGISACASQPASAATTTCDHRYDAGVICNNPDAAAATPPPASGSTNGSAWARGGSSYNCSASGAGAVQLIYGGKPSTTLPMGRVELCAQVPGRPAGVLEWGTVCDGEAGARRRGLGDRRGGGGGVCGKRGAHCVALWDAMQRNWKRVWVGRVSGWHQSKAKVQAAGGGRGSSSAGAAATSRLAGPPSM